MPPPTMSVVISYYRGADVIGEAVQSVSSRRFSRHV